MSTTSDAILEGVQKRNIPESVQKIPPVTPVTKPIPQTGAVQPQNPVNNQVQPQNPVNNQAQPQQQVESRSKDTVEKKTTETAVQPQLQEQPKITYTELINRLNVHKPLSDEELAKQRRRQKREALISAIGDGISSIANLVATTKGAPNTYDPRNSLSARNQVRWDKIREQQKADRDNYYKQMITAMQMDDQNDNNDRNYKAKIADMLERHSYHEGALQQGQQKLDNDAVKTNIETAYKGATLKETNRHNKAQEGNARTSNSIAGQRLAVDWYNAYHKTGTTSAKNKKYTIRLSDGSVANYSKDKEGAIKGLARTMVEKARKAAAKYMAANDYKNGRHFRDLADKIENSPQQSLNLVINNIGDFPSMDQDIRKIIGAGKSSKFNISNHQRKNIQSFQ